MPRQEWCMGPTSRSNIAFKRNAWIAFSANYDRCMVTSLLGLLVAQAMYQDWPPPLPSW